jgi:RimJ/RimL family protein N-acetyltransferase
MQPTIRPLTAADADAYVELRRNALLDAPLSFSASPEDDVAASVDAVRMQLGLAGETVVLGAFGPSLIGAVGLFRDRHRKAAHKMHLWGMYVAPSRRRRGVAAALLAAAIVHARSCAGVARMHLSVTSAAPDALRLYQRAGFEVWGSEPDALRYEGQSAIEHHLLLRL